MRVLWVHNFRPHAVSAGTWMVSLAAAMRRAGVEVDLHATGSLRSAGRLLAARRRVTAMSHEYDVAHAQFGSACGVATAGRRCRRVMSLRGTEMMGCDAGSWALRLHGRASRWMTHVSLAKFDRVLVMSQRMRDELARHHGRSHAVETLPSGIDLQRFRPLDRGEARRRLGCPGDERPWVLFASLHASNPVKRPQLAQAAFQRAQQRRPDLVFKTLHGTPHEQVPLWMNAANVLLLTSTREGWPNVVKEALACNMPFVSTDVSDLAGIAREEPACAVTAPNPDALADGLIAALDAVPSTNLRRHVEPMELNVIAAQLCSIYRSVLDAPQAKAA